MREVCRFHDVGSCSGLSSGAGVLIDDVAPSP